MKVGFIFEILTSCLTTYYNKTAPPKSSVLLLLSVTYSETAISSINGTSGVFKLSYGKFINPYSFLLRCRQLHLSAFCSVFPKSHFRASPFWCATGNTPEIKEWCADRLFDILLPYWPVLQGIFMSATPILLNRRMTSTEITRK